MPSSTQLHLSASNTPCTRRALKEMQPRPRKRNVDNDQDATNQQTGQRLQQTLLTGPTSSAGSYSNSAIKRPRSGPDPHENTAQGGVQKRLRLAQPNLGQAKQVISFELEISE